MAKKKAKKASGKSTKKERMQAAAIAAVMMELDRANAAGPAMQAGRGAPKAPREAWKMAGRAERLGIAPF